MEKAGLLNGLTLAYMGDAAYEVVIRRYLIKQGLTKPNQLHHQATQFVSAKAQAKIIVEMLEQDLLTEDEKTIYKRGRNAKSYSKAKNADQQSYSASTAFEAVMGYVYLSNQEDRFHELCQWAINYIKENEDV